MSAKPENPLTIEFMGNMPLPTLTHVMLGSFTTENHQPPQGEVMKLTLSKLENQPEPEKVAVPPPFGTHIREGVAVVKDWLKKPK